MPQRKRVLMPSSSPSFEWGSDALHTWRNQGDTYEQT